MENDKNTKITTPIAIVIAGFLVMLGIIISNGSVISKKEKTLSEQVGVQKEKFTKCIQDFDKNSFEEKINDNVVKVFKKEDGVGTPFSIVVGSNGIKSKIPGNDSYEGIKKVIDEVLSGKVTTTYEGDLPPINEEDHILGNKNAPIIIVEYSDFECPFCADFHPKLHKIIEESNGNVAWVYRHLPLVNLHQYAIERAIASECVAKIKGNDAFWKYADLLFEIITPKEDPVSEKL